MEGRLSEALILKITIQNRKNGYRRCDTGIVLASHAAEVIGSGAEVLRPTARAFK